MTFEEHVCAHVVDIRNHIPKHTEIYFIDTNVWSFFLSPHPLSRSSSYQVAYYPPFIKKLICENAKILRSELILVELSNVIEKLFYQIYKEKHAGAKSKKKFRNDERERKRVINELKRSWEIIQSISESIEITIDESISLFIMDNISKSYLDGYDLTYLHFILQYMDKPCILTDDKDFATVPNITVFTANNKVIKAARHKGLLLSG